MVTANQVIALARGQLGTKERPAGSNNVKYNTEYYGREVSGKYPWCCTFVWWLFNYLKANNLFYGGGKTASCTTLMTYAKKHGNWVTKNYRPGDLILYNWNGKKNEAHHIGVLEEVRSDGVVCIEGNTSMTSQDNGGNVMRRTRKYNVVVGAYRPNYVTASSTSFPSEKKEDKVTISLPVLRQGSKGNTVKALQSLLNGYGYDCGSVDGSFGPATLTAFKKCQKANGLSVDGVCGPASWATLLGV